MIQLRGGIMRSSDRGQAAPNYTSACVVMFGVNILWLFVVIWALWGLLAVALSGWAVNAMIDRIAARRG
ncbi:hypothetical protein [uncultured Sulfitobacter sp.]|jgi:hypothetical protein|uniref:hypothetical protein n=2 Tax=uncultured Sulfitobacter sp. TaxID=191468 RepID=UPI002599AE14|nr:hypothetical protein [uncultured Sulfitobacter sp.]